MNSVNIKLRYNQGFHWHTFTVGSLTIRVKGFVFSSNILFQEQEFAMLCAKIVSDCSETEYISRIREFCLTLNGTFAIILQNSNWLFAIVDRVRSIPLFYVEGQHEFFLSDDTEWLREKSDNIEPDTLSTQEFRLTGYVTGQDTLYPSIKQIQAGRFIYRNSEKLWSNGLKQHRYYQYIHDYSSENLSQSELLNQLDSTLVRIFERLIQFTQGHTIIVPLSSGYDSRLIMLMLKRLQYDNVVAFSYGRPNNKESDLSKSIASALGNQWIFVPYSKDLWKRWSRSKEWQEYYSYAHRYSSLPHIQDWPAVWHLKQQGIIPINSIFVPGHSADMPAGSRSSSLPDIYSINSFDQIRVIDSIMRYHYVLFDWSKEYKELSPEFTAKIQKTLDGLSFPDSASAFESWDTTERQAKFIINSLRVYEFWDYKWALPLWDNEFIDFWSHISLVYRRDKFLYDLYIQNLTDTFINTPDLTKRTDQNGLLHESLNALRKWSKEIVKTSAVLRSFKNAYLDFLAKKAYDSHPLEWHSILNRDEFMHIYPVPRNINAVLAYKWCKDNINGNHKAY